MRQGWRASALGMVLATMAAPLFAHGALACPGISLAGSRQLPHDPAIDAAVAEHTALVVVARTDAPLGELASGPRFPELRQASRATLPGGRATAYAIGPELDDEDRAEAPQSTCTADGIQLAVLVHKIAPEGGSHRRRALRRPVLEVLLDMTAPQAELAVVWRVQTANGGQVRTHRDSKTIAWGVRER